MSDIPLPLNASTLRRTLGMFATGVAVVTTQSRNGQSYGLTINSFNSVSLHPPLIIWSLNANSAAREAFENSEYHAVNILAEGQREISNLFASKRDDKFEQTTFESGLGNAPVLPDCCAVLEVRNTRHWEEGDHVMFIATVERCKHTETAPLIFFNGAYHKIR